MSVYTISYEEAKAYCYHFMDDTLGFSMITLYYWSDVNRFELVGFDHDADGEPINVDSLYVTRAVARRLFEDGYAAFMFAGSGACNMY